MNLSRILGWILIALPFVVIAIAIVVWMDFTALVYIFGSVAILLAVVTAGVCLADP